MRVTFINNPNPDLCRMATMPYLPAKDQIITFPGINAIYVVEAIHYDIEHDATLVFGSFESSSLGDKLLEAGWIEIMKVHPWAVTPF